MNASRLEAAVELRVGEKRTCQKQDLVCLAQLAHFSLQRLDVPSAVACPGRSPVSRACWRTQRRNVSGVQPILAAIDVKAAHCDPYSLSA